MKKGLKRSNGLRGLGLVFALAIMTFSALSAYAGVTDEVETEQEYYMGTADMYVEQEVYLGNAEDMILVEADPAETRAAISFGGAISVGATIYSDSTYYMEEREGYSYSVSWKPTGQKIKVVRINVDTGKIYGTSAKTGGSASGTVGGSTVPEGEYQFGIYNAGTMTITSCTCSINF